jgi:hypothetical protein
MKFDRKKIEGPQFLSGWKEIANYLGKGVRTVQRYEREMGLPVRRPAGKPRGSVMVTRAEIDAWVAASPIREAFQLTRSEASSSASVNDAIKSGIQEMNRLRDQMLALRRELRTSVDLLHASVEGVRGSVDKAWSNYSQSTLVEPGPRGPAVLDLVENYLKTSKAS